MENISSANNSEYGPDIPLDHTNLSDHFDYMRNLLAGSPEHNACLDKLFGYMEGQLAMLDETDGQPPEDQSLTFYDRPISAHYEIGDAIVVAASHSWEAVNDRGWGVYCARHDVAAPRDERIMRRYEALMESLRYRAFSIYNITPDRWLREVLGSGEVPE